MIFHPEAATLVSSKEMAAAIFPPYDSEKM